MSLNGRAKCDLASARLGQDEDRRGGSDGDTLAGVDTANAEFVAARRPEHSGWTPSHEAAGIATTIAGRLARHPTFVLQEATAATKRSERPGRWAGYQRPL